MDVIPVRPAGEPENFDSQVRQRGLRWLSECGWNPEHPPRQPGKLPNYWTECKGQLYEAYDGVCEYYAFKLPPIFTSEPAEPLEPATVDPWLTGEPSIDHFLPKATNPARLAYEWTNYRLASYRANRVKGSATDVLDPFELLEGTFQLRLGSGEVQANPTLDVAARKAAEDTIRRLQLNHGSLKRDRRLFLEKCAGGEVLADQLREECPFLYQELIRLGEYPPISEQPVASPDRWFHPSDSR